MFNHPVPHLSDLRNCVAFVNTMVFQKVLLTLLTKKMKTILILAAFLAVLIIESTCLLQ